MQYANINDAQAAMTSDQYVGLNADGTYGLFDRAQNPQWVGACQYAYQVAGVPFPKWFKWVFPKVIAFILISFVIMYVLTESGWTAF